MGTGFRKKKKQNIIKPCLFVLPVCGRYKIILYCIKNY